MGLKMMMIKKDKEHKIKMIIFNCLKMILTMKEIFKWNCVSGVLHRDVDDAVPVDGAGMVW